MNLTIVSLILALPFLFFAWAKNDPQNASEQIKKLHRKICLHFARRQAEAIIKREYALVRHQALQAGYNPEMVDTTLNEHQSDVLEQLIHQLYWRRVVDNGCA